MWFKNSGNNFHVFGTKTDLDSLSRDSRKQFRQIPLLFDNSVILERRISKSHQIRRHQSIRVQEPR